MSPGERSELAAQAHAIRGERPANTTENKLWRFFGQWKKSLQNNSEPEAGAAAPRSKSFAVYCSWTSKQGRKEEHSQ